MVVSTGRSPILDEVGGPPLEIRHLPAADRQAAYALCHELRVTCGSLDRSGIAGSYSLQPQRSAWRCLRDVGEESLLHVVRRVERTYPSWRLPEGDGIHERIEQFLLGGAR